MDLNEIGALHQIIADSVNNNEADIFIEHIKEHLEKGEKVCCKICGKTVEQIANQRIREMMAGLIGAEETDKALKNTTSEDNGT